MLNEVMKWGPNPIGLLSLEEVDTPGRHAHKERPCEDIARR